MLHLQNFSVLFLDPGCLSSSSLLLIQHELPVPILLTPQSLQKRSSLFSFVVVLSLKGMQAQNGNYGYLKEN